MQNDDNDEIRRNSTLRCGQNRLVSLSSSPNWGINKMKGGGKMPTVNLIRTGENIVNLRNRNNLSVRDLQTAFGFATPQAIYKWQQGQSLPTVDNLVILAMIFNVNIDDILVLDRVS